MGDREVHVGTQLIARCLHASAISFFQKREAELERFHFAKDRAHYVCGRGMLRVLLGSYLDVPPENVPFPYGPNGKPELSPVFRHTDLHFNLSHSHGQLLVAIARHCALGVDIERIRSEMDVERIAERFFSFAETQQLDALTGIAKWDGFFNGWTRKEAYLKARGEGIGDGLDQFAVSLIPGNSARLLFDRRDPNAVSRWSIRDLATSSGFAAALVVEATDFTLRRFAWDTFSSSVECTRHCGGPLLPRACLSCSLTVDCGTIAQKFCKNRTPIRNQ